MRPTRPTTVLAVRPARRGSAAKSVLLVAMVAVLGFAAFLVWQDRETKRLAEVAETEAAARAAEEAARAEAEAKKKRAEEEMPDIVVVKEEPKVPREREPIEEGVNVLVTAEKPPLPPLEMGEIKEGAKLLTVLASEHYKYTPTVQTAYFAFMKAQARIDLERAKKVLPADFLAWAESTPEVALTVYGGKARPLGVLLWLRSLEIDLGRDVVRSKYTQLALATAMVADGDGKVADITPRAPLKLVIPGDPRKPVNTKDKTRVLDKNDAIINFLEDHAPITGDIVGGMAQALPELVYNSSGIATSFASGHKKISPTVKREVIAADVLASSALQKEFNAYMAAKGFPVDIDCGERTIFPGLSEMIKGPHAKGIMDAYKLFRTAYEEKGRLALREKPATYAERCAYLIHNDGGKIPGSYGPKKNKVPRFPLNAPWPMLTLLAAIDDPLREREELLLRLKKNGEFHTYGEYIGPIAQQLDYQRARRLAPYAFGYSTERYRVQGDAMAMVIKDGGVCGLMASMCVHSFSMVGIPACQAGQPGHCALIFATRDEKNHKFDFVGGQYVTGGHDMTHPHTPWYFADLDKSKPMIWHQSAAYGVNFGMKPFMESMAVYQLVNALPEDLKKAHGHALLASAATLNPFNMALADASLTSASTVDDQLKTWDTLSAAISSNAGKAGYDNSDGKKGKAKDGGLYLRTLFDRMAYHLTTLPVTTDKAKLEIVAAHYKTLSAHIAEDKEKLKKANDSL